MFGEIGRESLTLSTLTRVFNLYVHTGESILATRHEELTCDECK